MDLGSVRKDVEEVFYLVKQFEVLPYQVNFFAKRSTDPPRTILLAIICHLLPLFCVLHTYATLPLSYFYHYSLFDQQPSLLIIFFFLCNTHLPSLFLFTLLSLFSILISYFSTFPSLHVLLSPYCLYLPFFLFIFISSFSSRYSDFPPYLPRCLSLLVSSPSRLFPVSCLPSVLFFSSL